MLWILFPAGSKSSFSGGTARPRAPPPPLTSAPPLSSPSPSISPPPLSSPPPLLSLRLVTPDTELHVLSSLDSTSGESNLTQRRLCWPNRKTISATSLSSHLCATKAQSFITTADGHTHRHTHIAGGIMRRWILVCGIFRVKLRSQQDSFFFLHSFLVPQPIITLPVFTVDPPTPGNAPVPHVGI